MTSIAMAYAGLLYVAAFVCGIIILVAAFKDEVWKGLLCFFCGIYALYYGLAEFESEYKTPIIILWLPGGIVGALIFMKIGILAGLQHAGAMPGPGMHP